jgi:CPA2 family monovalent cation:H+ antiporter-2
MAFPLEADAFKDIVVVLGAAGLVIPAFAAMRISPVVGFILVGVAVGPFGFGALTGQVPALRYLTISDATVLAAPAEIGIALLLFALGLELSFERLKTMRKLVFGLGAAQLTSCALIIGLMLLPLGFPALTTLTLALALAMSSTAVGLQMLSASGRMGTQAGRMAFGILLFQDISIAPILLLLGAGGAAGGFFGSIAKGMLAIAGVVVVTRMLVPALFLQAARTRRPEFFLAASLVVLIGSAAATAFVGISPAIGALIAGVMLAETDYRRQIEAAIAPFQGLLLGVFLIWVGMQLDFGEVLANPVLIIGGVIAICAAKALTIFLVLRRTAPSKGTAGHVALLLAAPSETSLIVIGTTFTIGMMSEAVADTAMLIAGLSLAIAPLLGLLGQQIETRFAAAPDPTLVTLPVVPGRTIIIGYGRVGRLVAAMLERHNEPYLAVDSDPDEVAMLRRSGVQVVYGDARRPELIDALGLDSARAVVLTVDDAHSLDTLVRLIRDRYPQLIVVARARDADHASRLYELGVTNAVPETVESSLQLAEALLVDLGKPIGPIIASIHEMRHELRGHIKGELPTQASVSRRFAAAAALRKGEPLPPPEPVELEG